jgi:predicted methyltransferase
VTPVPCNQESADLPPNSVDLFFVCNTYHHFEFPQRTLTSLHRALNSGGRLIVADFIPEPGKSWEWILNHVRAGQEVVEKEVTAAGFKNTGEVTDRFKENYLVVFEKARRRGK